MSACTSCGADWGAGDFTPGCAQCGGGALERPCLVCEGRCGRTLRRAVLDSQDSNEAHWIGACGLPPDEQQALIRDRLPQDR